MITGRVLASVVTLCLFLICVSSGDTPQPDLPALPAPAAETGAFENLLRAMVLVKARITEDKSIRDGMVEEVMQRGSGFYISADGLILTAYHTIEKVMTQQNPEIYVRSGDQDTFVGAYVVKAFEEADLVLLQDARSNLSTLPHLDLFDSLSIEQAMPLYAFGFPSELSSDHYGVTISRGILTDIHRDLKESDEIPAQRGVSLMSCDVWSGFSGGALTDTSFTLVGVVLGSVVEHSVRYGYARPIEETRTLLRPILKEYGYLD